MLLKIFSHPLVNIPIAILLIFKFSTIQQGFFATHPFLAQQNALDRLKGRPTDLIWQLHQQVQAPTMFEQMNLKSHISYYLKLRERVSVEDQGVIDGLLGYCFYQVGDLDKAHSYFLKAYTAKKYFWYAFDLAIIAVKAHQQDKAIQYLTEAVHQNPQKTLQIIRDSSHILLMSWPAHVSGEVVKESLLPRLQDNYTIANNLLSILSSGNILNESQWKNLNQLPINTYVY